jgi:hypothetical protein
VDASRTIMKTRGDVKLKIKLDEQENIQDKFTIMDNLPFEGILGARLMGKLSFSMHSIGDFVSLNQVLICILPKYEIQKILQTQNSGDQIGAKFLCVINKILENASQTVSNEQAFVDQQIRDTAAFQFKSDTDLIYASINNNSERGSLYDDHEIQSGITSWVALFSHLEGDLVD